MPSHLPVCILCLRDVWRDHRTRTYREPATGILFSNLLRARTTDHRMILQALLSNVRDLPHLVKYIRAWARGHFILGAL
jgi:cellulose synthase operon protein C